MVPILSIRIGLTGIDWSDEVGVFPLFNESVGIFYLNDKSQIAASGFRSSLSLRFANSISCLSIQSILKELCFYRKYPSGDRCPGRIFEPQRRY